jgi:hypothetical protein
VYLIGVLPSNITKAPMLGQFEQIPNLQDRLKFNAPEAHHFRFNTSIYLAHLSEFYGTALRFCS